MTYSLTKVGSNIGDSGGMSMLLYVDDVGALQHLNDARPRVGGAIRVGSVYARSYSAQDWWQTSKIVEILEDKPNYVKFTTRSGSTYEWTKDD